MKIGAEIKRVINKEENPLSKTNYDELCKINLAQQLGKQLAEILEVETIQTEETETKRIECIVLKMEDMGNIAFLLRAIERITKTTKYESSVGRELEAIKSIFRKTS